MSTEPTYIHLLKRQPTQARSIQRVDGILDAAAELLGVREPAAITIRELAAVAGVPTGTVYQFFDDKDAVLQALAVRFVAAMPQVLDETLAGAGDAWTDTLDRVVDAYADMARAHPALRRLWLSGTLDAATRTIERETDATLAARLGALLRDQAGSTGGSQAEWETLVAIINALLIHAFTLDPEGDETALHEARRAVRAYAAVVLT